MSFFLGVMRYQAADAGRAAQVLVALAETVKTNWDGYLQRFLRVHGQRMADELEAVLKTSGIEGGASAKIAILWLQNVANIPLLLPTDRHIQEFCKEHGLSEKALVETADNLGLNIAVLDDLLALEASAGIKTSPVPKSKKAAAGALTSKLTKRSL
jgi:hypothetical protein